MCRYWNLTEIGSITVSTQSVSQCSLVYWFITIDSVQVCRLIAKCLATCALLTIVYNIIMSLWCVCTHWVMYSCLHQNYTYSFRYPVYKASPRTPCWCILLSFREFYVRKYPDITLQRQDCFLVINVKPYIQTRAMPRQYCLRGTVIMMDIPWANDSAD